MDIQNLATAVLNQVSVLAVQLTQEKQQHQETCSKFQKAQKEMKELMWVPPSQDGLHPSCN